MTVSKNFERLHIFEDFVPNYTLLKSFALNDEDKKNFQHQEQRLVSKGPPYNEPLCPSVICILKLIRESSLFPTGETPNQNGLVIPNLSVS